MTMRFPALMLASCLVPLLGCGGDSDVFELHILSRDVVVGAIDRVEIVLQPGEIDQDFMKIDDQDYFKGSVTTRVSNAGEFVITANSTYIDEHLKPSDNPTVSGYEFTLDIPLSTGQKAGSGIADPLLTVTFIRGDDRIARGGQTVAWPFKAGKVNIDVRCVDMDDNVAKCMTGLP